MIKIPKEIVNEIIEQGKKEAPIEACGYLAGRDETVLKHYPMTNIDKSEDHFSLDPKEQFKILKEARNEGLKIIGIYHTHPVSPASPSEEDSRLAYDPDISYVIVSLLNDNKESIKSFKRENNTLIREDLEVI